MTIEEKFASIEESIKTLVSIAEKVATIMEIKNQNTDTPESGYPPEDNRDAWIIMAKDRGIEIPPRTKTPTIVKHVMNYEMAKLSAPVDDTDMPIEDEDLDPFGVNEATEKITLDGIREVFQKYISNSTDQAAAKAAVKKIINTMGGVEIFNKIPEDKFEDVMGKAEKLLASVTEAA